MPFVKKSSGQGDLVSPSNRALFIGRTHELLFFVQHLLKPEEPAYNILSIWGQGGVGKTTLLRQFKNQAETADFQAYCLTAIVDERQETPASMMEQLAQQLHLGSTFEKALHRYKEAIQLLPPTRMAQSWQDKMVTKVPDLAGALIEGVIPVAGPLLGEGVKATTEHLLDLHSPTKEYSAAVKPDGPLHTLTQVFLTELNRLASTKVTLPATRTKRERRLLLFFDTFERVADEVVPWLLHSVLELEINRNIVFILAGRNPIERSTAAGPKPWLPYYDDHTIYALSLHPFTQEETAAYLAERGITAKEHIETIWHMSQGLPLYLGLLVSNMRGKLDPTKDVVDNFLQDIPAEEKTKRRLVLDAALFSRPFNQDDLEAFPSLSEQERPVLYEWLLRQPFVRASSLSGRYVYHDVAQELFQRHLHQSSPKAYYAARRALAAHYQRQYDDLCMVQEKNQYGPSDERLEVMLALVSQRFFLPEEGNHLQALLPLFDIFDYDDFEQRQTVLRMLRKTVQILSRRQANSHAHQVAQAYLSCLETQPTQYDQTHQQEWLAAIDHLLKLSKHTASPELLASIYDQCGWGYLRLKGYQQGLTWLERALEFQPLSERIQGRIQNGLGHAHCYLKEYQQALDHFNHGIKLVPYHPHLYLGRGKTYERQGAYQQALSDFDYALQLDWQQVYAYSRRGRIYLELKDYRKALVNWDHMLEVAPEHPRAASVQFQRGCANLWLKDLLQATTCFTRSYELASIHVFFSWAQDFVIWVREWATMCQAPPGPHTLYHIQAIAGGNHYTGYVSKGVIFFLQKEFQQALTVLHHATTFHYDEYWYMDFWADFWREWDAYFWLAMVYLALDQEDEACKAIEQVLAFDIPPILLKPLRWFEQDKPELYKQLIKPLLDSYQV